MSKYKVLKLDRMKIKSIARMITTMQPTTELDREQFIRELVRSYGQQSASDCADCADCSDCSDCADTALLETLTSK